MPSKKITWPSEGDLKIAESPEVIHLCRVLIGLRRLSRSGEPPSLSGVSMTRATHKLVDVLLTVEARVAVLRTQLTDGTATPAAQRDFADQVEEAVDLIRSHADDTDAGIVAASRHLLHTE
ncbi:hypothetical protein AB0C38_36340 [Amycolatopsis sp. NPDC048633]|uniref:hypothetical protein n=1 Tax=Amycolatopsis sp. NPDC048633 TaxID=3157095 RepID=UPI0033FC2B08